MTRSVQALPALFVMGVMASIALGSSACSSEPPTRAEPIPMAAPPTVHPPPFDGDSMAPFPVVDRQKELLVTSRDVLSGARSDATRSDAPWSFRHLVEALAPTGEGAAFVSAWLATWQSTSTVPAQGTLPLVARPDVREALVCPWLRLTPANACDATCSQCTSETLDLTRAPFRLLAIVNRLDLAEQQNRCDEEAAEARLVFVATDATGAALPFNVIFEYGVIGTEAADPRAWHVLAGLGGEPYAAALERITRAVTDNGRATLKQIRTSENLGTARGTAYELRQFERGETRLVASALTHTARDALNGTTRLAEHVSTSFGQIMQGDNAITLDMRTASSLMPRADHRWSAPADGNSGAMDLFGLSTCNGCHAGHRGDTNVLPFSHVGVDARGETVVSRFLDDPANRTQDELAFRERALGRRLTGACGSSESSYASRRGTKGGLEKNTGGPKRVH